MISIFLILFILYAISTRGRTGHKGLAALQGWAYAHRGLHTDDIPENSMSAFQAAIQAGYGAELDVHLMRDGQLAVIHDSSLKRVAGADVNIEELTAEDLANYTLGNTQEHIPLLKDVLALFAGKAPLIVELKTAGNNYAALAETTCKLLDSYPITYCIESFDPRCVYWLKQNRPDVIRGQLAENSLRAKRSQVPFHLRFALTYHLLSFLTQPDFVAYKFAHRKNLSNFIARKLWGVQGVAWTITSQQDFNTAVQEGWLPIFERFRP